MIINLYDFPRKSSFHNQHYSRLCFTITYSRTSTRRARSTQRTSQQRVQYLTSTNGHISHGQPAPTIEIIFQNNRAIQMARYARSLRWTSHKYYKWLQTQQQKQYYKTKSNINTYSLSLQTSAATNSLPATPCQQRTPYQSYIANVTGIESLGNTEPAQILLPARTQSHMLYEYPNERCVIVDRFPFISDVILVFRDVCRIPRLLLAASNIVPAHSADCDTSPSELAEVHMYYPYCSIRRL